jgi:hypothetical protein
MVTFGDIAIDPHSTSNCPVNARRPRLTPLPAIFGNFAALSISTPHIGNFDLPTCRTGFFYKLNAGDQPRGALAASAGSALLGTL